MSSSLPGFQIRTAKSTMNANFQHKCVWVLWENDFFLNFVGFCITWNVGLSSLFKNIISTSRNLKKKYFLTKLLLEINLSFLSFLIVFMVRVLDPWRLELILCKLKLFMIWAFLEQEIGSRNLSEIKDCLISNKSVSQVLW